MVSYNLLNTVRFMDLNKWSANYSFFEKITSTYPLSPLSNVLKRIKENPEVKRLGIFVYRKLNYFAS